MLHINTHLSQIKEKYSSCIHVNEKNVIVCIRSEK